MYHSRTCCNSAQECQGYDRPVYDRSWKADINVSDMTNKAKGDYAYALIDVDSQITDDVLKKLQAIDDVLRVRVVK